MVLRKILLFCLTIAMIKIVQSQSVDDSVQVYEGDPVVLTGTRTATPKSRVPTSLSVISRETIESYNEVNVLPVLTEQVPGLFLNARNPAGFGVGPGSGGNLSIRGISGTPNTRVLILIDGQPQFMGIFGHPISDAYTASDIESVEVIRGAASLLYGSNALGGAINIITRKREAEGAHLGGIVEYGSFETLKISTHGGWRKGQTSVYASFNREQSAGVREVGKDDFSNTTGYLKLQTPIYKDILLTVDGNLADARYNHPGPLSDPITNDQRDYLRGRAAVSLENNFQNLDGALKLYYNFGDHEFSTGFQSTDFTRGLTFYQNINILKRSKLTLGIDYQDVGGEAQNENLSPPANKGFDESLSTQEWSAYGVIRHSLGKKLNIQAGLRWTHHSLYGQALTPGAGFSWMPGTETVIKGAINNAFRSPSIVELYLFPPSNQDLNPEQLWNYELGISQDFFKGMLRVELTGYIMQGDNLIQQVLPGSPPPRYINTGSFTHQGIELIASARPAKDLELSINYHFLDVSREVLYAPRGQMNFQVNYRLDPFQLNVSIKSMDDLTIGLDPVEKESVILLNAMLSSTITPWLTLYVKGQNLTDSEYQFDRGFPMPGISTFVGARFRLH